MKIISLFLILCSHYFFSQTTTGNIMFSDLLFAYANNYEQTSNRITDKNYYLYDTYEKEGYETAVWKLNSDKESTFFAKICLEENCGRVHIQSDNVNFYKALKNTALKNGFKFSHSERAEELNAIFSSYKFKEFTMLFSEGSKNGTATYTISLQK